MRFEAFSFGSISIDGTTYGYDVVIDRGRIRKRKKKPSKRFRDRAQHYVPVTPDSPVFLSNWARSSRWQPIKALWLAVCLLGCYR
jgi:hypothetical protein